MQLQVEGGTWSDRGYLAERSGRSPALPAPVPSTLLGHQLARCTTPSGAAMTPVSRSCTYAHGDRVRGQYCLLL